MRSASSVTRTRQWPLTTSPGTALVGISSYAQEALGDVVFVDLPEVGAKFEAGDEFGTVESVKTVSEIFMPSAGEILAVNEELEAHPEFVNEDAFGKGWMVKIKLTGALAGDLLDAAGYAALVSEESH